MTRFSGAPAAARTPRRLLLGVLALLALVLALPAVTPAAAQVPAQIEPGDTLVEVRLADGSTLYGRVVEVEGDRIVLQTEAGARVELERAQIRSIAPVRGRVREGEVWMDDPHATRLFFAPTGRSLAEGGGYFGVYELFFPFLTFGITDRVTVTGGTPVVPGLIGEFAYFGPKLLVVDAPRTKVSAGVLTGIFDGGMAGVAYGVGTWGDADHSLTGGAAWGFFSGEGNSGVSDEPLLMIGGEARTGRRTKLLTENYFVPGESSVAVSGGIRFWGERLSADAGLAAIVGGENECCFPLVNFVYSFGKR